ncbi:MAG: ribbon-helix-helix domain-containing protein [Armatimonadetes bacterium]|nr:ribbon-helix-helix domain-containing protein [Armatimonadota bacterium]
MPTTTVRLPEKTRATLRELSRETGEPMSVLLEKAVEAYRRQCIFQQANAAYAALRSDPKAWAEEVAERQEWEGTLGDDLAEAKL